MTGPQARPAGRRRAWPVLAALWLAWLVPATAAMLAYVDRYQFGRALLWPHLAIVSVFLLALALAGAAIAHLPLGAAIRRALVTVLLAAAHFALLCCYALFFLAWEAWNQPASLGVIAAYLPQVPRLLQALPISGPLAAAAVVLLMLAVLMPYALASRALAGALAGAGAWLALHYRGWTRPWCTAVLLTVLLAAPWLLAQAAWNFSAAGAAMKEPFFLAFVAPGKEVGSMRLDADSVLRAAREREIAANYASPGPLRRKNLVVITVDALRSDQMSVYGLPRETTPFLDRLHARGAPRAHRPGLFGVRRILLRAAGGADFQVLAPGDAAELRPAGSAQASGLQGELHAGRGPYQLLRPARGLRQGHRRISRRFHARRKQRSRLHE